VGTNGANVTLNLLIASSKGSGWGLGTNTLVHPILMAKFIETGLYDKHLRRFRNILRKQLHLVVKAIDKYFSKGIRMVIPKGGFLLWIQLPEGVNSVELYRNLLGEDIVIWPDFFSG